MIENANLTSALAVLKKTRGTEHLAKLLTKLGTHNPYGKRRGGITTTTHGSVKARLWDEQASINLPTLYLACLALRHFAQKNGCTHFLFATRDCVHFCRVFQAMFPDADAHYFVCSRNMFNGAGKQENLHYRRYVESCTGGGDIVRSVYVDIHGTGRRMAQYFAARWGGRVPACLLLSSGKAGPGRLPRLCQGLWRAGRMAVLAFGLAGSPIEMLNYDKVGTVNGFCSDGPVRAPLEYDARRLGPYHECADAFVGLLRDRTPRSGYPAFTPAMLGCMKRLLRNVRARRNRPLIAMWVRHERVHKRAIPQPPSAPYVPVTVRAKKKKKKKKKRRLSI